jgi:polar amino acid transport system permease protein
MLNEEVWRGLLAGAEITVQLTFLSAILGTFMSIVSGLAGMSSSRTIRWTNQVYVDFFRGSSAIIQLFWVYYALPLVGPSFSAMEAGVLVLGLNMGSYGSEVVRGALRAVPQGQTEAAIALNLNAYQRIRYITFPQALVAMLPPYGNLLIELLKATALVSLITLGDILWEARVLRNRGVESTAVIFTAALFMYFFLALGITALVRLAERFASRGMSAGGRL